MNYYFNILVNCILLITTPALLAIPQVEAYPYRTPENFEAHDANSTAFASFSEKDEKLQQRLQEILPFTFDDLMGFIDTIENGNLEKYSDRQLEQMCQVLVFLARQGFASHDEFGRAILENDIAELLAEFEIWEEDFFYDESSFMVPTLYYEGQLQIVHCKSLWKKLKKNCGKKWKHARRFCNEHKKEIAIAAALVAAVAVVACIAAAASAQAAAAAAAGAGAMIDSSNESSSHHSPDPSTLSIDSGNDSIDFGYNSPNENADQANKHSDNISEEYSWVTREPHEPSTQIDNTLVENALNQMVVDDRIEAFKTDAMQDLERSSANKLRGFCSKLAHDLYDVVGGIVLEAGHAQDTFSYLSSYLPFGMSNPPVEEDDDFFSYEELAEEKNNFVHESIDRFLSTKLAHQYTSEYKLNSNELTLGVLPVTPRSVAGMTRARQAIGVAEIAAAEMEALEGRVLIAENGAFVNAASSRMSPTLASNTWGWKIGQDITNRTRWGSVPKWSTVRQRYWKNIAHEIKSNPNFTYDYATPENIKRMENGLAPQRFLEKMNRWESRELHHTPPQRDGGIFDFVEVWPDEHALLDLHRYTGN